MKELILARASRLWPPAGLSLLVALAPAIRAQEADPGQDKVLLYPVEGVLDEELSRKLRADIQEWITREPSIRSVILRIDSPGTRDGRLEPASEAAEFLSALRGVRVIAHLATDKAAGNASAVLALASRDLVMSPGSRLGFLPSGDRPALEVKDGESREEKDGQEARRLFQKHAEVRRGPIGRSHLAEAMVSRHHPAIFKVRFEKVAGNRKEEEVRFLTQEETANLGQVEKQLWRPPDVLAVAAGQKLTMDQEKAREYGFAIPVGSDDRHEVLLALNLKVGEENILDHKTGGALKPLSPPAQTLVDFLNHPVVRFLLVLAGTLGFLLEVKMPGTLIPAISGLVCFAIFFIAGLYPSGEPRVPTTSVFEVLLFLSGLGLLAIELLLLPGVILFGLFGAAACFISLVLAMVPPANVSGAGGMDYREAITLLVSSAGTGALIFLLLLRFLPRSRFFDRSGIVIHSSIQGTPTADSAIDAQARSAALIGRSGHALTPLRPAGLVEVQGERLDVVAEGEFVEKGEKIEIIEADGTRIVVRKILQGKLGPG